MGAALCRWGAFKEPVMPYLSNFVRWFIKYYSSFEYFFGTERFLIKILTVGTPVKYIDVYKKSVNNLTSEFS